jgi:predicted GIY-YIG superfamily endonuclease
MTSLDNTLVSTTDGLINNIYILELNDGKYYIGKSNNIHYRYKQHLNGEGSEWTKKYHPIRIIHNFISQNEFDEDSTTKFYMKKYGIDNVRGGSYCQIILPEILKEFIQREFYHVDNKCLNCIT